MKNTGSKTWDSNTKLGTTQPRDQPSPVAASDWKSMTRVSTLAADVPPGMVGRFPLELTGNQVGDYSQTFGLVEEGVTWFADAPKGGGPSDDFLRVHVIVGDAQANGDGGWTYSGKNQDGSAGGPGGNGNGPGGTSHGGCSTSGAPGGNLPPVLLVLFFVAVLIRRRLTSR
jgi:MYXO-CTERM domain-containing protein